MRIESADRSRGGQSVLPGCHDAAVATRPAATDAVPPSLSKCRCSMVEEAMEHDRIGVLPRVGTDTSATGIRDGTTYSVRPASQASRRAAPDRPSPAPAGRRSARSRRDHEAAPQTAPDAPIAPKPVMDLHAAVDAWLDVRRELDEATPATADWLRLRTIEHDRRAAYLALMETRDPSAGPEGGTATSSPLDRTSGTVAEAPRS